MMDKLISGFASQLKEAMQIGEKPGLKPLASLPQNVLISGLGGSGIGGTIVSELFADEIPVPIVVSKTYHLPAFVNKNTLVIISSYSGNTEETLHSLEQALERKAMIFCITSGGKVAEMAAKHGLNILRIPGGMPPRTCLGFSLVQQLYILAHCNLISTRFKKELEAAISLLEIEQKSIQSSARDTALKLENKIPVIYSTAGNEGIAIRFRQQLNENSKILCWHHVIPEMNHNELVGWTKKNDQLAVILFRDPNEFERNNTRIGINKGILSNYTSTLIELFAKGNSRIEKALYMVHLGDWISWYLAEKRGVDAVEVRVIDYLKSELSKS